MLKLKDEQIANIRLECIKLVVNSGARNDMQNPRIKADLYYNYVIDNIEESQSHSEPIETEEKVEEPVPQKQEKTIADGNPFSDNGRNKVLLS